MTNWTEADWVKDTLVEPEKAHALGILSIAWNDVEASLVQVLAACVGSDPLAKSLTEKEVE